MIRFFNSISVGVWKLNTSISEVSLVLHGQGNIIVRFGLQRIGHAHKWLSEDQIVLTENGTSIEMPFWNNLDDGMLYLQIEALSETVLFWGGEFVTSNNPSTNVTLGVVITHFNRKNYVVPAIQRIETQLLNDPCYDGKIDLIVVDNSKNITQEEAGIKPIILPNKNLGGSGGFTRGLLYLEEQKRYTHCLFMDDDASCEVESLRRAFALLSFSINDNLSIAGSLMRELQPEFLYEKGAVFNNVVFPLKAGFNMRVIKDLLYAEHVDVKPNYGAWWFFAFPINKVSCYPYPFFVRGDDILFGRENKFDIITMNGIGCWGDDFSLKAGPVPSYMDMKNHLIQNFFSKKSTRLNAIKLIFQFFISNAFSYNYASTNAVLNAVEDVMKGPEYWIDNIDMSEIRKKIGEYPYQEKMQPICLSDYRFSLPKNKRSRSKTLIRWMFLNGYLLPQVAFNKSKVLLPKGFRANFSSVFRAKDILYYYEPLKIGYIAKHSKKYFFLNLIRFIRIVLKYNSNYSGLKRKYVEKI
ncbi:glycosyltransferase family protein [Dickeya oryzae]